MSYPPPVYHGASGEASATVRAAARPPDVVYPSGSALHVVATGATTGGRFGLYRWEMAAAPGGANRHFHRSFTESFYVLAGRVRLYDGRRWIDGEPGAFVHVPEGGVHGFRNESGEPASMLIHFAPGAPREAYFEGLLELEQMSEEERVAFFLRHDNHWL